MISIKRGGSASLIQKTPKHTERQRRTEEEEEEEEEEDEEEEEEEEKDEEGKRELGFGFDCKLR